MTRRLAWVVVGLFCLMNAGPAAADPLPWTKLPGPNCAAVDSPPRSVQIPHVDGVPDRVHLPRLVHSAPVGVHATTLCAAPVDDCDKGIGTSPSGPKVVACATTVAAYASAPPTDPAACARALATSECAHV